MSLWDSNSAVSPRCLPFPNVPHPSLLTPSEDIYFPWTWDKQDGVWLRRSILTGLPIFTSSSNGPSLSDQKTQDASTSPVNMPTSYPASTPPKPTSTVKKTVTSSKTGSCSSPPRDLGESWWTDAPTLSHSSPPSSPNTPETTYCLMRRSKRTARRLFAPSCPYTLASSPSSESRSAYKTGFKTLSDPMLIDPSLSGSSDLQD